MHLDASTKTCIPILKKNYFISIDAQSEKIYFHFHWNCAFIRSESFRVSTLGFGTRDKGYGLPLATFQPALRVFINVQILLIEMVLVSIVFLQ